MGVMDDQIRAILWVIDGLDNQTRLTPRLVTAVWLSGVQEYLQVRRPALLEAVKSLRAVSGDS